MLNILYAVVVGLTVAVSGITEEPSTDKTSQDQNCTKVIDLCFVADSSKSVCQSDPTYNSTTDKSCRNWEMIIDFMYNTALKLDIGERATRVACVVFASKGFIRWKLPKYTEKEPLLAAIRGLQFIAGSTNTSGALDVTRDQVCGNDTRKNATKVIIIITDGNADNLTAAQIAIDKTHAAGILSVAVGISRAINRDALKQLASDPKEENKTYFPVPDFNILDRILPSIQTVICHDLPIIAANYTTTTPAPVCSKKLDIVFVLDSSHRICSGDRMCKRRVKGCGNWKTALGFVHAAVDRLAIGPDNANVGFVTFATKAILRFRLSSFQDRASLGQAIDRIPYTAGSTNTSGGLDVMNSVAFSPANGAREDAKKICIVLTGSRPANQSAVQPAVDRARAANVTIVAVGFTDKISEESVKQLSSMPQLKNKNYFLAANLETLDAILNYLSSQICSAATTTPIP